MTAYVCTNGTAQRLVAGAFQTSCQSRTFHGPLSWVDIVALAKMPVKAWPIRLITSVLGTPGAIQHSQHIIIFQFKGLDAHTFECIYVFIDLSKETFPFSSAPLLRTGVFHYCYRPRLTAISMAFMVSTNQVKVSSLKVFEP